MPFLERADAPKLYYQEDRVDSPIGDALLVHGFGDHCGRYDAFTERLNGLGLNLLSYDYRGHGRSEGRVGDFEQFQDYLDDLQVFWERLRAGAAERPCFLLGHSNGGLIAFTAAANVLEGCAVLVLSSPFFGLKMPIPLWKRAALKVLNDLLPDEGKLYQHYLKQQPAEPKAALTHKLWENLLIHPQASGPVLEVSDILWRAAAPALAQNERDFGLDKKKEEGAEIAAAATTTTAEPEEEKKTSPTPTLTRQDTPKPGLEAMLDDNEAAKEE